MNAFIGGASGRRLAYRRRMMSGGGPPAADIGLPILLGTPVKDITTQTTVSFGPITVEAGDIVVTCHASRGSASRTHNVPTSTLPGTPTFAQAQQFTQIDTDQNVWCHGSMFYALCPTAGSGTITQTFGSTLARIFAVLRIPKASAFGVAVKTQHEAGTNISADLGSVPPASAVGLSMVSRRIVDTSVTDPPGFTQLYDDVASAGGLQLMIHAKLGSAPQVCLYDGLTSGEAEGLIYATFLD